MLKGEEEGQGGSIFKKEEKKIIFHNFVFDLFSVLCNVGLGQHLRI